MCLCLSVCLLPTNALQTAITWKQDCLQLQKLLDNWQKLSSLVSLQRKLAGSSQKLAKSEKPNKKVTGNAEQRIAPIKVMYIEYKFIFKSDVGNCIRKFLSKVTTTTLTFTTQPFLTFGHTFSYISSSSHTFKY